MRKILYKVNVCGKNRVYIRFKFFGVRIAIYFNWWLWNTATNDYGFVSFVRF